MLERSVVDALEMKQSVKVIVVVHSEDLTGLREHNFAAGEHVSPARGGADKKQSEAMPLSCRTVRGCSYAAKQHAHSNQSKIPHFSCMQVVLDAADRAGTAVVL